MSLIDNIRKDMFKASKEGQKEKSEILKMALAEIKNVQIAVEEELKETDVEKILRKEVKKIKDSIEQFANMNRDDLVEKEEIQLEVLESYLPDLLDDEEVRKVVVGKIEELEAESLRDMGKVMGSVMKEFEGKADGNTVKEIVQELLS